MQEMKKDKREQQGFLRRFLRHRMATVGFLVLTVLVVGVIVLPYVLNLDPYTTGQGMPFSAPHDRASLWYGQRRT